MNNNQVNDFYQTKETTFDNQISTSSDSPMETSTQSTKSKRRINLKIKKPNLRRFLKRKYLGFLVIILLIIGGLFLISKPRSAGNNANTQISLPSALATKELNKDFSFPIKDDKGTEVGKITYTIQNAEIRNEIIVNGQKATAIKGKAFLIFNLKLTNNTNNGISLNSKDYIRISTDKKEWLAPDIHNDPVNVQAISTKLTRLGFPINENDKKFTVAVGEINGEKTDFDLLF